MSTRNKVLSSIGFLLLLMVLVIAILEIGNRLDANAEAKANAIVSAMPTATPWVIEVEITRVAEVKPKEVQLTVTPTPELQASSEAEATAEVFELETAGNEPNNPRQIPISIVPAQARQFDFSGGNFWVDGGVETAVNIEQAKGEFKNSLGMGTQSWLAEPGKLLVNGFDFDLTVMKNSGGAIDHWNPTNQAVFGWAPPAYWNLNEGGFALAVANRATIRVPDRATIHFEGDERTAWIVILRGLYSDFQTPSDRNLTLEIADYVPGSVMFARYSGTPNGGFVSEGQFLQLAETTQGGSNNCGESGCPMLYALFYDSNTGAWLVLQRSAPSASWESVASNMDYLQ